MNRTNRKDQKTPKILIVGLGPGNADEMTPRAIRALESCDVIVGYSVYIDLVNEILPGRDTRAFPMKHEVARCREALAIALADSQPTPEGEARTVGIVSSGDPGVYGMAGVMLEVADEANAAVDVEVVPGITACCAAGARIGAPLTHDFAVVSLSDLLTPLHVIEHRISAAAEADFVICMYNPSSRKRHDYLRRACDLIARFRSPDTPSAWVRMAGRSGEAYQILTLDELSRADVDMFCTIFVGNSTTKRLGDRLVTPRGYRVARD